jgi:hypothetical protein
MIIPPVIRRLDGYFEGRARRASPFAVFAGAEILASPRRGEADDVCVGG